MRRLLLLMLAILPALAWSATYRWRMEWNPIPAEQTVHGECLINGQWTEVGTAPGNGVIRFELSGNAGEQKPCRGYTTLLGLPDSPRSEVAVAVFPLEAPTVRVVREP